MSVENFIPTIWTAKILRAMKNAQVMAFLANRDYEGDISEKGDTVHIPQLGEINVSTYTKNSTTLTYQELTDAASILSIDQAKYVAWLLDDVDKAQTLMGLMDEATNRGAYKLADTADSYLLGLYGDAGLSQNTNSSPVNMTSLNVEEEFLSVAEQMDEANAQREGRFAVIPPWVMTKLVLAGVSTKTDNDTVYANGFIKRMLGFDFYMSNNVSVGTASTGAQTRIMCGVAKQSYTFAEQITKMEALRSDTTFGDKMRGLHLYGGKIVRPDITCVLYADKTAEA